MFIACGLVLLGEAERYSKGSLIGISVAILIIMLGIFIIGLKKTKIQANELESATQKTDENQDNKKEMCFEHFFESEADA